MVLTMNNFSFNNEDYLQKHGTAMGTRMTPSYANLFMGKFEQQAIDNSLLKPFIWGRFIDDIFMIWTHGEEHLKTFIGYLNSIHPSIKFSHGIPIISARHSLSQMFKFISSTTTSKQISTQSLQANINTSSRHCTTQTTPKRPSYSASSSESAYVLPTLSLTNDAENSSSTWPNVVIAVSHYKEMPIAFAQFHVT